jgi:NAD(P)-dependent dehydrogenase (short-subunit alcohol dehydrogenase family)
VDGDVSKKETAVQVVEAAIKHFGRIDLLVNNAGIFIPKPFTEYTEDEYNQVMNTNVASMFFMTQQVIPQMKQQHSGHVVNISVALADQPAAGLPAFLAILSKSPTPAVSKALALEFAADNIRFNTVSPGVVNTPMHANSDHAVLAKFHPLNRIAETSDIADAVLYLQNATFVTGENIHVDGGFHAAANPSTWLMELPIYSRSSSAPKTVTREWSQERSACRKTRRSSSKPSSKPRNAQK